MKEWTDHLVSPESLGCSVNENMECLASALIARQRLQWPRLARGLRNLKDARFKEISDPHGTGTVILVQNSGRYGSASADPLTDDYCPLCLDNLPPEERGFPMGSSFIVLPNPDPIMQHHLIASHRRHVPQEIRSGLDMLLELAASLGDNMLVFYNGPSCGASSPFHLHLQIGLRSSLPIVSHALTTPPDLEYSDDTVTIRALESFGRRIILLSADHADIVKSTLVQLLKRLNYSQEPPINLIIWTEEHTYHSALFPRGKHRPECFYRDDPDRILISPGSVEMGGLIVVPRPQDWEKVNAGIIDRIYREVSVNQSTWSSLLEDLHQIDV